MSEFAHIEVRPNGDVVLMDTSLETATNVHIEARPNGDVVLVDETDVAHIEVRPNGDVVLIT